MNQSDLVSVIIPCFNSGATINKTIDSVKNQTYLNIEIIVVDDGSNCELTMATLNLLTDVILIRQKNKGLAAARNKAINSAKGNYILPLDADDWIENKMIEKLLNSINSSNKSFYSYCDIVLENERAGVICNEYNFFKQLFINQIPYCMLVSRQLFNIIGGYDENMRSGYEDWELNIRLGKAGFFPAHVREPLFHYRVSKNGMLISKSNLYHGYLWSFLQRKHYDLYSIKNIFKLSTVWSYKTSIGSIIFYFLLFFSHKIFPNIIFTFFFRIFRAKNRLLTFSGDK
jgi:glycosyltransferase involved in cell wall biosynthesis